MYFTRFEIKNFKGIEHVVLDLTAKPGGQVYTLVGLNESGKTTILEAISTFEASKQEEVLYKDTHKTSTAQDFVPKSKKSNFTGTISIAASIQFDDGDKEKISKFIKDSYSIALNEDKLNDGFRVTKCFDFEDSNHTKTRTLWNISLSGVKGRATKEKEFQVHSEEWTGTIAFIARMIPSICYFPTFLFDFPSKIYLEESDNESKLNIYYRKIIQDILDSLNENLDLQKHIVDRVKEDKGSGNFWLNPLLLYRGDTKAQIDSVLLKVGDRISEVIFNTWNEIFDRQLKNKSILVSFSTEVDPEDPESQKVYLEFFIKDGPHQYAISERSLGFRWFFCFLLFTQFRGYRKANKDTLFLFDEPASNLHSGAQNQLLESFPKVTKQKSSIIYSTHSHHMINPHWLENTYIVQNTSIDYDRDSYEEATSRGTNIKVDRYKNFVTANPNKVTYFQPILDKLDYKPSKLESVSDAILLEGKLDFYALSYFDKIIFEGKYGLDFIPGSGAHDMNGILSLYLGWGKNFVILLDGDKAGKDAKNMYMEEWLIPENNIYTIADINEKWDGFTIEDIFSERDREQISKKEEVGNSKKSKKALARFIQEKISIGEKGNFEKETKDNFKLILDFCSEKLKKTSGTDGQSNRKIA